MESIVTICTFSAVFTLNQISADLTGEWDSFVDRERSALHENFAHAPAAGAPPVAKAYSWRTIADVGKVNG